MVNAASLLVLRRSKRRKLSRNTDRRVGTLPSDQGSVSGSVHRSMDGVKAE